MSFLLDTLSLNNTYYAVIVTRRCKSRAFTLRLKQASCELHISAPKRASKKEIMRFFTESVPRIEEHIRRTPAISPLWLEEGATIPLCGTPTIITFDKNDNDGCFYVPYHHGNPSHAILKALQRHFLAYVQDVIATLLTQPHFAHLPTPHITLKDTRSRWGSCAVKQARIMLSWRLIFAPAHVSRSVIVHEMVHFLHPNHSTAFWEVVAAHDGYYEISNTWLRKQGKTLFAYSRLT